MFERLTSQNRYAILHRLGQLKRAETRTRRIEEYVAMLARGETIYPQKSLAVSAHGGYDRRCSRAAVGSRDPR